MTETKSGIGASIVLYQTSIEQVSPLLSDLERAGIRKIYIVDNSPLSDSCGGRSSLAPIIELIETGENLGFGRAQNIAVRKSVELHRYHLICNPDITLSDGVIASLTSFMDENPDVGLCMPKLVGTDGQIQYCCRRSPVAADYISQILFPNTWGKRRKESLEMRAYDYSKPMDAQCLSGCFMFFRSDVLRQLGGFDDRFFLYFEDFDLSRRSQVLARNVYLPSAWVVHERQSAHRKSWRLKKVFASSAVKYFWKWGWL